MSAQDFFKAAKSGNIEALSKNLNDGIKVNALNTYDESALFIAVTENQHEVVEFLLMRGADVNLGRGNTTPLLRATEKLDPDDKMVELLIKNRADVNKQDDFSSTALHYSLESPVIVEKLLAAGANLTLTDKDGHTPLQKAKSELEEGLVDPDLIEATKDSMKLIKKKMKQEQSPKMEEELSKKKKKPK